MEESLRKIQVGLTAYTFGVCQYAGYMGSGLYKLNSIIPLRYWTAVSHQCTCIWLLPHSVMLPPVTPAMAQRRADKKAKQIAQDVLARRSRPRPRRKSPSTSSRAASGRRSWPARRRSLPSAMRASLAVSAPGSARAATSASRAAAPSSAATASSAWSCLQYCPQQAISIGRITDRREHYHNPNVTAAELTESIIHID